MLTIGKIGNDKRQQLYYDDRSRRAPRTITRARARRPGSWHGDTAAEMGLSGRADRRAAAADVRRPSPGDGGAVRPPTEGVEQAAGDRRV